MLHDNAAFTWHKFVSRLTSALREYPNVPSYEIYNEENVKQWWDGTARDYNQVLKVGAAAIRSVNPAAQILFGGMVWPDNQWMGTACTTYGNARNFDIVAFRAYPETWTPPEVDIEHYLQGYADFLKHVDQDCGRKPIWINEAGFATTPGKSEMDQANWWARAIATFAAAPRIEHIGIYEIRDAPQQKRVIGESANYYLGLLRRDRVKKLAFQTVAALAPLLNAKNLIVADSEIRLTVTANSAGRLYHHLFVRDDGHQFLFLWDKTANPQLRVEFQRSGSSAIEIRLNGERNSYPILQGDVLKDVQLRAWFAYLKFCQPDRSECFCAEDRMLSANDEVSADSCNAKHLTPILR